MKRRTVILGGGALVATAVVAGASSLLLKRTSQVIVAKQFDWKGTDFLSGGTKAVQWADLPEPAFRALPNCVTTLAQTIGPCDTDGVPERVDISEGQTGLPVRFAFRIVDAATCKPIKGARLDIWHADPRGIYSGKDAAKMCTENDPVALAGLAFRGIQFSNDDGRVDFVSTYPGWYSSRCIHVHCRIQIDGRDALISQIFFDDNLSKLIYADHPDYLKRGAPDTPNEADSIASLVPFEEHVFDFEKLESGVLQATYTVGVSL
jgi:protocatechuate 3,4-dioxygenase beta subunit